MKTVRQDPSSDNPRKRRKKRNSGLPGRLKGAAGRAVAGKYTIAHRDEAELRPQPSMPTVAWLERPDPCPELAGRAWAVDGESRVIACGSVDQVKRSARLAGEADR